MVRGGRRGEGSGWGTCIYLWRIHVDIPIQDCKVKKKIKPIYEIFKNLNIKAELIFLVEN